MSINANRVVKVMVILIASCCAGTGMAQEDAPKDIYYYYNAFTAAYKDQNYPAYLEHLEGAFALRPEHPGIMYGIAGAHALLGNHTDAYFWLDRLARAGLVVPAPSDSDFVSLWDTERFKSIAARFEVNRQPVGASSPVFTLAEKGLIAESVAYDAGTETFYVSSVRERKIIRVSKDGVTSDFSNAADSLMGVFGMKVDPVHGVLWACIGAVPQMRGYVQGQESITSVVAYDLQTGSKTQSHHLPRDESPHLFGDLIITAKGNLIMTDSYAPRVYRLSQGGDAIELLVEIENFVSPQGLALAPDGNTLFVADYLNGICAIDLQSKKQTLLSHPDTVVVMGIDGLYFYENSLIAVQNGVRPNRVMRFHLTEDLTAIQRGEILEANHPDFAEPTLGMIVENAFYYVGSSQWGAVDDEGNLLPEEELKPHIVFKTDLN